MEFIGDKGLAAPRLKDAELNGEQLQKAYFDVLKIMRKMFNDWKLIHGDLSEYNMLYFKEEIYVIDVSQSVEHEHPMALDFLRRDCVNINDYFSKQNVVTLSTEHAYDFITDYKLKADDEDTVLQKLLEDSALQQQNMTPEESRRLEIDDKVFRSIYIPRSLHEIEMEDLDKLENNKEFRDLDKSQEEDSSEESAPVESKEKKKKFDPFENMSKKERKLKVKEENRERRINKMPKNLKKKLTKKGGNKK